jgi:hypothetical protein
MGAGVTASVPEHPACQHLHLSQVQVAAYMEGSRSLWQHWSIPIPRACAPPPASSPRWRGEMTASSQTQVEGPLAILLLRLRLLLRAPWVSTGPSFGVHGLCLLKLV